MKKILIAAVAAILVIGLLVWHPWSTKKMHITADFADASGLFVGNDVGVLGVPVGKVTDITPEGDGVKVELEVDGDLSVPKDSFAKVVARSVATDRYVELSAYTGGDKLADGGTIPLERTGSPVDFDEVLKSLQVLSDGLSNSPEAKLAVKRLVDSADAALGGKGPLLNKTINSLGGSTKILADQRQNIANLITSLDEVVKIINKNKASADTFITEVSQASSLLASQKQNFHAALVALNSVVAQLAQFDHDNRDLITANLQDTTTLMNVVLSRQNQVAEVLGTFPVALRNLQNAVVGNQLRVRLEPTALLPLGQQLHSICTTVSSTLCTLIDGTAGLTTLLGIG